jgi:hypothetical protein
VVLDFDELAFGLGPLREPDDFIKVDSLVHSAAMARCGARFLAILRTPPGIVTVVAGCVSLPLNTRTFRSAMMMLPMQSSGCVRQ